MAGNGNVMWVELNVHMLQGISRGSNMGLA